MSIAVINKVSLAHGQAVPEGLSAGAQLSWAPRASPKPEPRTLNLAWDTEGTNRYLLNE